MRVVLFSDAKLPLVSVRLVFAYGDVDDPEDLVGIGSATAAMLSEGTENYTSKGFADEVERLGASIGASSGADSTVVAGSALSIYREDLLRLLSEVVMRPVFPDQELDLYKTNTVEGLKFQRSQPSFLADEQFSKALYGDHPYAVVSPSADDIGRLDRDALVAHHRRMFNPRHATVIAVGDFENGEFTAELEDHFGSWEGGPETRLERPCGEGNAGRRFVIVDRPGSSQANILMGNRAIARDNPDFFPILVLNQILGAGASSRLFMNLREEKGYTYGAYSKFTTRRLGGDFEASAEVRTEVVGESVAEFMKELARIRDERVSDTELADAVNYLTGVFPLRAETQEGLVNLLVQQEVYGLPEDYLRTYRDMVAAVSAEDVTRVARSYIRPEDLTMVIVGDGREVLESTRGWCTSVSVVDTDGRPVDLDGSVDEMDFEGEWELDLDFQGQPVKVSMVLRRDGAGLVGELTTPLGIGTVKGEVSGGRMTAVATADVGGAPLKLEIVCHQQGEGIAGEISSDAIPTKLPFSGGRK
jgi:predicted Zn-dependent peptidase